MTEIIKSVDDERLLTNMRKAEAFFHVKELQLGKAQRAYDQALQAYEVAAAAYHKASGSANDSAF